MASVYRMWLTIWESAFLEADVILKHATIPVTNMNLNDVVSRIDRSVPATIKRVR